MTSLEQDVLLAIHENRFEAIQNRSNPEDLFIALMNIGMEDTVNLEART